MVLAQQAAKYLLTSLHRAKAGKQLSGSVDYMNHAGTSKFRVNELTAETIMEAWKWLSITLLTEAGIKVEADISAGKFTMEEKENV